MKGLADIVTHGMSSSTSFAGAVYNGLQEVLLATSFSRAEGEGEKLLVSRQLRAKRALARDQIQAMGPVRRRRQAGRWADLAPSSSRSSQRDGGLMSMLDWPEEAAWSARRYSIAWVQAHFRYSLGMRLQGADEEQQNIWSYAFVVALHFQS